MTTTKTDAKFDQVHKLLAQAKSIAGTPEADVFNAKAFDLIAKYGIDEAAARAGTSDGPAPILRSDVVHTGSYRMQQCMLAQARMAGQLALGA